MKQPAKHITLPGKYLLIAFLSLVLNEQDACPADIEQGKNRAAERQDPIGKKTDEETGLEGQEVITVRGRLSPDLHLVGKGSECIFQGGGQED